VVSGISHAKAKLIVGLNVFPTEIQPAVPPLSAVTFKGLTRDVKSDYYKLRFAC
jgi:hypothetical protein